MLAESVDGLFPLMNTYLACQCVVTRFIVIVQIFVVMLTWLDPTLCRIRLVSPCWGIPLGNQSQLVCREREVVFICDIGTCNRISISTCGPGSDFLYQ